MLLPSKTFREWMSTIAPLSCSKIQLVLKLSDSNPSLASLLISRRFSPIRRSTISLRSLMYQRKTHGMNNPLSLKLKRNKRRAKHPQKKSNRLKMMRSLWEAMTTIHTHPSRRLTPSAVIGQLKPESARELLWDKLKKEDNWWKSNL